MVTAVVNVSDRGKITASCTSLIRGCFLRRRAVLFSIRHRVASQCGDRMLSVCSFYVHVRRTILKGASHDDNQQQNVPLNQPLED